MTEKVTIFSTYSQAENYRKELAMRGDTHAFDVHVATPFSWLKDAWDLYGGVENLVSPLQRSVLLASLLKGVENLPQTAGMITLLTRLVCDYSGQQEFEKACSSVPQYLSFPEQSVLGIVERYKEVLVTRNLIEWGSAVARLNVVMPKTELVFAQNTKVPLWLDSLSSCGALSYSVPACSDIEVAPLHEGVDVSFLLSAGPTAQASLLVRKMKEIIGQKGEHVNILLVTKKPQALFSSLQLACEKYAWSAVVEDRTFFANTHFGRAYSSLFNLCFNNQESMRAVSDYLFSPYSGISYQEAKDLDVLIRSDRTLTASQIREMLLLNCPTFEYFEELLQDFDASIVLGHFKDLTASFFAPDSVQYAVELRAISALYEVYGACRGVLDSVSEGGFFLKNMQIKTSSSFLLEADSKSVITICDMHTASKKQSGSFAVVMLCNMDEDSYPAKEDHSALQTLKEKLHIAKNGSNLDDMRACFNAVLQCACNELVFERSLHSADGEELQAAFFLDELCALYSADQKDMDQRGIPAAFKDNVLQAGEEQFESNIYANVPVSFVSHDIKVARGELLQSQSRGILLPRTKTGKVRMSPSSIEAYLQCPYCWFIDKRLYSDELDEAFGNLERGTFAHSVLEQFYQQLSKEGIQRITQDNLIFSEELFGSVFDEQLRHQYELTLSEKRYVPCTPTELIEAQQLKDALLQSIRYQSLMLPGFVPDNHEYRIEEEDNITYAGVVLTGRVDRVDVNYEQGYFAVLDYKGSVNGHDAGCADLDNLVLPDKVQTLIYAQALRKKYSDFKPVAALYLSYCAKLGKAYCSGSYSSSLVTIEGISKKSDVQVNFEAYLDAVEQAIVKRLEPLLAGDISPNPVSKNSCVHCSYIECERRLS